ncbi:MAG: LTA synthase family protein [Chthoniobacterales bacterium]
MSDFAVWRFWILGYAIFFLFILWDSTLAFLRPGELPFSILAYTCSLVISFLFWTALRLFLVILPSWGQNIFSGIVALISALILSVNTKAYWPFGQYLSESMIQFLKRDSAYNLSYIKGYLFNWSGVWLIALIIIFYFIWHPRIHPKVSLKKVILLLTAAILFLLSLLINLGGNLSKYRLGIDTSLLVALTGNSTNPKNITLTIGNRFPVTPSLQKEKFTPNIILFFNESLGRRIDGLKFYGGNSNAMPFLSGLIKEHSKDFFIFQNALSNSTASDVSIPSLLTGIGPERSAKDLLQAPLLWEWLKAVNPDYKTLFISSTTFYWANLNQILGFSEIEDVYTAKELPGEYINDLGIDEAIATKKFTQIIQNIPDNKQFIAVYYSNAIHYPFQTESLFFSGEAPGNTRISKALRIIDTAFKEMWTTLENSKRLDETIIIFTADHGEMAVSENRGHRLYSYYEEYWGVPFIIIIPEALQKKIPIEKIESLLSNRKKLISNLDIIPSLVDLFSLEETNQLNVKTLSGNSLFKELPEDRFIIGLSTNDLRGWGQEGFGIARGSERLIYNNVSGMFYYDLAKDPKQKNNLLDKMPSDLQEEYLKVIQANYHLSRILRPPVK